jgi:hypothetical protein
LLILLWWRWPGRVLLRLARVASGPGWLRVGGPFAGMLAPTWAGRLVPGWCGNAGALWPGASRST